MKAPMLLPFLSLASGILLAFSGCGVWVGVLFIIAGSVIYIFINHYKDNPLRYYKYSMLHYTWIILWFLGIGIINENQSQPDNPDHAELSNIVAAQGRIEAIKNSTSGDKLTIDLFHTYDGSGQEIRWNNFKVFAYSDAVSASIGDIIVFPVKEIKPIKDSDNTFHKGYAETMAQKGIFYTIQLSGNEISVTGREFSLTALSVSIRDRVVTFIEKQPLKKKTRDFIITLLTGDRDYLDNETRNIFADAGISHILALSGLHIGIISGILLIFLFPLNFIGKYKLRFFLTALLLWIYAFITGMSPSIVRACVMASAFITAIILERKNTALNSLFLAGFIILLFSPNAIIEVGFQLSFICVFSLIVFSEKFNPINRRIHPKLYYINSLILASIITTLSSWIVVAYYFHSFPTMFLPTNLLILPTIPLYVILILLSFVFSLSGIQLGLLNTLVDKYYDWIHSIASFFANDSSLHVTVSTISVIIWLTGLIVLAIAIYNKTLLRKYGIAASGLLFITSILITIIIPIDQLDKGILICNTYPYVEIKISDGMEEKNLPVPVNAISLHHLNNVNICIVDYHEFPKNLCLPEARIDFLVITGKYKGSIQEIKELCDPQIIITHPSIRKKREKELLAEAETLNQNTHSLREKKALKILKE